MLGIFFTVLSSGINTFFHFRNPAPYISPFMIQIVVYPVGKALAWIMPIRSWYLPSWLGSYELTFNPGPFNIKEHTCIVVMANAAIAPTYALYPIVSAELWYKHDFGIGFNLLYTLSCQITGFSFAGLCRRFVIWPASMIWPGILVVATNLNTLHAEDESFQGGMTRFRFLMITGGAAFAWYFLPGKWRIRWRIRGTDDNGSSRIGFLFTALSYFSFACWIAPRNNIVNQLFGVSTGLGMGLITFDWSQINWIGSPLTAPWWAQVNIAIGFLLFYWIVTPILYYCNVSEFRLKWRSTDQFAPGLVYCSFAYQRGPSRRQVWLGIRYIPDPHARDRSQHDGICSVLSHLSIGDIQHDFHAGLCAGDGADCPHCTTSRAKNIPSDPQRQNRGRRHSHEAHAAIRRSSRLVVRRPLPRVLHFCRCGNRGLRHWFASLGILGGHPVILDLLHSRGVHLRDDESAHRHQLDGRVDPGIHIQRSTYPRNGELTGCDVLPLALMSAAR